MSAYQSDGRSRAARRQVDVARQAAIEGHWEDAAELNRQILQSYPRDVEALNRLGKAYLELGQLEDALDAYQNSLSVDAANAIAQRNVNRIEQLIALRGSSAGEILSSKEWSPFNAGAFIEEVGKTYVTDLQQPGPNEILRLISPADQLEIRIEENQVNLFDLIGNRVGQLEPRIGQLLVQLTEIGNRYQAYVVALTGNTVRIILREVYRDPDTPAALAFPRQATIAAPRPYLRDTKRMARELEPDLLMDGDDDDDDDDAEEDDIEDIDEADSDSEDEEYAGESDNEDEDDEDEEETTLAN